MSSTVITHFNYQPDSGLLIVHYISGAIYSYKNVPPEVYEAIKSAFSKGQFLNSKIKGQYPFEKLR